MRPIKPADIVTFADDWLQEEYISLAENNWLRKAISRAIARFKENAFCGERLRKELIPKEYIRKYGINNLSWYQLPSAWRLVYSVVLTDNKTIVMVIEYFDHKEYEKRFGY